MTVTELITTGCGTARLEYLSISSYAHKKLLLALL
jgi:hypothetical protein